MTIEDNKATAAEFFARFTANDIEGWDSFNHISVIVAVETRFGLKMTTSEIEHLADVGALVAAIENKLSGSQG